VSLAELLRLVIFLVNMEQGIDTKPYQDGRRHILRHTAYCPAQ
jgi:hypothetical protein